MQCGRQVFGHPFLSEPRLQYADDDQILLMGEVLDVFGHEDAMLAGRHAGNLGIGPSIDSSVTYVDGVVTVFRQRSAGRGREHLVNQERHAYEAIRLARCSAS